MDNVIKYSGKVEAKVYIGKKLLKKYSFHNAGSNLLFRFLCECLAGDYKDADRFRPMRIKLMHNQSASPITATFGNTQSVSGYLSIDSAPRINIKTVDGDDKYSVTFHFLVPYTYLSGAVSSGELSVNQINLYTSKAGVDANNNSGLLAYYYFVDARDEEEWDELTIPENENTNIIIDWTMSFENK